MICSVFYGLCHRLILIVMFHAHRRARDGRLIKELTVVEARAYIAEGTISGGMIPKVETCIQAIEAGVEGVVILDGKTAHAVLLEIFTEHGAGTLIVH